MSLLLLSIDKGLRRLDTLILKKSVQKLKHFILNCFFIVILSLPFCLETYSWLEIWCHHRISDKLLSKLWWVLWILRVLSLGLGNRRWKIRNDLSLVQVIYRMVFLMLMSSIDNLIYWHISDLIWGQYQGFVHVNFTFHSWYHRIHKTIAIYVPTTAEILISLLLLSFM